MSCCKIGRSVRRHISFFVTCSHYFYMVWDKHLLFIWNFISSSFWAIRCCVVMCRRNSRKKKFEKKCYKELLHPKIWLRYNNYYCQLNIYKLSCAQLQIVKLLNINAVFLFHLFLITGLKFILPFVTIDAVLPSHL